MEVPSQKIPHAKEKHKLPRVEYKYSRDSPGGIGKLHVSIPSFYSVKQ